MTVCDCRCHQIEQDETAKKSNCGRCGNTGIIIEGTSPENIQFEPSETKPMFVKGAKTLTDSKTLADLEG